MLVPIMIYCISCLAMSFVISRSLASKISKADTPNIEKYLRILIIFVLGIIGGMVALFILLLWNNFGG